MKLVGRNKILGAIEAALAPSTARQYKLTPEAGECFPEVGPTVLVIVDTFRDGVRVAPLSDHGADLSAAFSVFREDLMEIVS